MLMCLSYAHLSMLYAWNRLTFLLIQLLSDHLDAVIEHWNVSWTFNMKIIHFQTKYLPNLAQTFMNPLDIF